MESRSRVVDTIDEVSPGAWYLIIGVLAVICPLYPLCPLSPLVLPINHAYALLCHCSVYLLSLLPPPPLRFEEAIISRADAGLAFWQGRLAD